jgi:hypothetical protein
MRGEVWRLLAEDGLHKVVLQLNNSGSVRGIED